LPRRRCSERCGRAKEGAMREWARLELAREVCFSLQPNARETVYLVSEFCYDFTIYQG
jgi:hypothetical protein